MCGSSSLIHCFVFLKWPRQMGGGYSFLDTSLYSVSTERGKLEDEAGCSGIVWFTQVAISQ